MIFHDFLVLFEIVVIYVPFNEKVLNLEGIHFLFVFDNF